MPVNLKKDDMGDVITDFYKSDAPQFKGKSKKKRREMAIAAKLSADEVKEGASILKVRGKRNTYMGATGDHRRDKEGNIEASFYNKKPAPVGEKHGDKSNRPKRPKPADVRAGKKKNETVRAALNRFKNYEREKSKAYAGDAKRKAAKTGEYSEGVMDIVNRYKKKKEEKKPQKAQDAGARARRVLKRREYQSKVSAIVPAELEDQKVWDRIKKIW